MLYYFHIYLLMIINKWEGLFYSNFHRSYDDPFDCPSNRNRRTRVLSSSSAYGLPTGPSTGFMVLIKTTATVGK